MIYWIASSYHIFQSVLNEKCVNWSCCSLPPLFSNALIWITCRCVFIISWHHSYPNPRIKPEICFISGTHVWNQLKKRLKKPQRAPKTRFSLRGWPWRQRTAKRTTLSWRAQRGESSDGLPELARVAVSRLSSICVPSIASLARTRATSHGCPNLLELDVGKSHKQGYP